MVWFTKHRLSVAARQIKYPLKLWSFFGLKLAYFFKWKKIPFLPVTLDIEPNNNCNFRCPHCQVNYWDKEEVYLDETTFVQILNQLPNLIRVKLQGMGEPLLNKQFIPMLKIGEARGITMLFHSNGSMCHQKIAKQLAQLSNTTIIFSIDGATEETFEKIRPGSKFEQIKKK